MTSLPRGMLALLVSAMALIALPSSAQAGTYTVRACQADGINNSWQTYRSNGFADAYIQCPGGVIINGRPNEGMIARNTGGPGTAPGFSNAMVYFDPPQGARVVRISGQASQNGTGSWQAGIHDQGNNRWLWCGPGCTSTFGYWVNFDIGGLATTRVAALVICGASECARNALHGVIAIKDVNVVVAEDGGPSVDIVGGSLISGGWHRGARTLDVSAADAVGIREVVALVEDFQAIRHIRSCNDTQVAPCPNGVDSFQIDTTKIPDGWHGISARAVDSAGNLSQTQRNVAIDNTAPAGPQDITIDRGEGWRAQNAFRLGWKNPSQNGVAPIEGVEFRLCPAASAPEDHTGCQLGSRSGSELASIEGLQVPSAGAWRARFWLRDAAGNQDEKTGREILLRFDDEPPVLSFLATDPQDPTRIRVRAVDGTSGLAGGAIELRREGEHSWRPLPVELGGAGFSSVVDDEGLPAGRYTMRARTVDHAGNERSTDRDAQGDPAGITLPMRVTTRIAVGKVKRVRAKKAKGGYRRILVVRPRSRYGRTIPLHGRLTTPGANPLVDRDVEVSERVELVGAEWRRIATVRTSRTGRFVFSALRGPSRILRFRYPGTPTIRGITSEVDLRVKAVTSMRVSRHSVVNGEEVTFRGRLKGGPLPPTSKLVQLQAFSRGRWLTFATPRASPRTGLWSFRYRFAATRGRVRYRFRARVPKEAAYPFETGTSALVAVTVRGL